LTDNDSSISRGKKTKRTFSRSSQFVRCDLVFCSTKFTKPSFAFSFLLLFNRVSEAIVSVILSIMSTESWASFHSRYQTEEFRRSSTLVPSSPLRNSFSGVFGCLSNLVGRRLPSPHTLERMPIHRCHDHQVVDGFCL
jgi:hypothetical protein